MMDLQKESLIMIVRQSNEATFILSRLEIRIHDRHTFLMPAIPYEAAKSYSWKPVTEQAKAQQRGEG